MPVKQLTEIARTGKSTGVCHIGHGHSGVSKHSTSLFKAIAVPSLCRLEIAEAELHGSLGFRRHIRGRKGAVWQV